jgi:hypothetical protein
MILAYCSKMQNMGNRNLKDYKWENFKQEFIGIFIKVINQEIRK